MTPSAPASDSPTTFQRANSTRAALVIGMPLGGCVLVLVQMGVFQSPLVERYLSHWVEWAEVVLFCCALIALGSKFLQAWGERRVARSGVLPPWDGQTAPVSEAGVLLAGVEGLPRRLASTWLAGRVRAVLEFVRSRNSTAELDDQMRSLADADAAAMDGSYSLLRFICWAIPILGFLGTVLGITEAVAGVTPEILEQSLDKVTGGLAVAFDTTALALGLTMILMFLSFLTERLEGSVLEAVDAYIDRELAHRFERLAGEGGQHTEAVRHDIQAMLRATEQLVQKQADIWARTFRETETLREKAERQQQERITTALEAALQRTLQSHAQQLAAQERQAVERGTELLQQLTAMAEVVRATGHEQREALTEVASGIVAQADVLGRLQDGDRQLLHLQDLLNQNLSAIAGVGTFEQAVHSLNAAVHMLSAVAVQAPSARMAGRRPSAPDEPGKAA